MHANQTDEGTGVHANQAVEGAGVHCMQGADAQLDMVVLLRKCAPTDAGRSCVGPRSVALALAL